MHNLRKSRQGVYFTNLFVQSENVEYTEFEIKGGIQFHQLYATKTNTKLLVKLTPEAQPIVQ